MDKKALFHDYGLRPCQPRQDRGENDAHRNHGIRQPDPEHPRNADGQHYGGEGEQRVDQAAACLVDPATLGQAESEAQRHANDGRQVDRDLSRPGLDKRRVVAAVVRLLEKTLARVGNTEYARDNNSFGLTTLRARHTRVEGSRIKFDFRGKHGIEHHLDLRDRRLATIVKRCRDLPGQHLFQFIGTDGARHAIGSEDVNSYLSDVTGKDITAKDFRTCAATNLAAIALTELEQYDSEAKTKKNVLRAVEAVASLLGNTPSVCRKCYIHPAIFDGYLDGSLLEGLKKRADDVLDEHPPGLTAEEVAVTAFLSRRLDAAVRTKNGATLATPGHHPKTRTRQRK